MEIIVISSETAEPNEHDWVIKLFEAGLNRFHLRKPGISDNELADYLERIPSVWRDRIILHQAFDLVKPYELGGWHFKDDSMQLQRADFWRRSRNEGQVLSRSMHTLDDLNEDLSRWDYVFLSPVFQSISKRNYGPRWEQAQLTAALCYCKEAYHTPVYALGGVDASSVSRCGEMGFDGVAVLGAIWQNRYPLESFLKIKEALSLSMKS